MGMDFSTLLAPPEDKTDKDDEVEVDRFATVKISQCESRNSSQCTEEEPQQNGEDVGKEGRPSASEETRNTGSVAGKVFSGYLSAGSNCFVVLLVFASNLLCQVTTPVNTTVIKCQSISHKLTNQGFLLWL